MNYYVGKLMYCPEPDHGVCDECGEIILIKSNDDLTTAKPWKLNRYFAIQELLEQNDCEEIKLEKCDDEEDFNDYIKDFPTITILEIDLKDLQ